MNHTLTIHLVVERLVIAALLLFGFGLWYNSRVEAWERDGSDRGYMSFIVAIGCGVVVAAFGLAVNVWLVIPLLALFAAAGVPMMLGSVRRYLDARRAADQARDRAAVETLENRR